MIQLTVGLIFKEFIKTLNQVAVVTFRGRTTISDESRLYRQICNVCKRIVEEDPQIAAKFNKLSDKRKALFYAKLVYLVTKNLHLQITYSWYLRGPMPVVHQIAIQSFEKTPLQGARKKDPALFSEVKKTMCMLDKLGIFDADSFLVNFYRACAPATLKELYLAKEDLIREPNNENFSRFETELTVLKDTLGLESSVFEILLEFGILYSSLNDIRLQEMDWLMDYLKVISQYVTIYTMDGPRKEDELKRKRNQLPKDIKQLQKTIESLRAKLLEKGNADKLHQTVTVGHHASELLS